MRAEAVMCWNAGLRFTLSVGDAVTSRGRGKRGEVGAVGTCPGWKGHISYTVVITWLQVAESSRTSTTTLFGSRLQQAQYK